ncbi:hypothetical protein KXD40_002739 [Peronospora effusa]|uniref:Uncharacterized protein n=1 Tax=Peronospora effusa TaxID=542832 RepID=A0A3M6VKZ4_9STRA|nr:hypothetical protein DD238_001600 [Peronospora effusa]RQM12482.1 hypothetical protein DD237_004780 [Peronospora effusa]UIZ29881.1 hypothetical protein KXD40_002739 [Peronospora effusa]
MKPTKVDAVDPFVTPVERTVVYPATSSNKVATVVEIVHDAVEVAILEQELAVSLGHVDSGFSTAIRTSQQPY